MAYNLHSEQYTNATIDLDDQTITEFDEDADEIRVYSLDAFLKRWGGVDGVTLSIMRDDPVKTLEEFH